MEYPVVSIVTPSYNQGKFIEESITSILSQNYPNIEYSVMDGNSIDNTLEVLRKYNDKIKWISEPDRGQAAAINEGISKIRNAFFVSWLNADDLLLPNGIKSMGSFLNNHPEYIAVFAKAYIIDENGKIIGEYSTKPFSKKTFAVKCTICQPASLIRRSAWDEVGGLDESIQTSLDYDLWWRLSKIGKLGYLEQFVACSRDHVQSKTRMLRKKVNDETISILLRHRGMVPRNWCMANILEGLEEGHGLPIWERRWKAIKRYVQINRWKALWPQNWLI